MAEFKGTPGEWFIQYGGMPNDEGFGIGHKGIEGRPRHLGIVAECWPCAVMSEARAELLANARLIAQAPRMLEQLIEARRELSNYTRDHFGGNNHSAMECIADIDAVIQRATEGT